MKIIFEIEMMPTSPNGSQYSKPSDNRNAHKQKSCFPFNMLDYFLINLFSGNRNKNSFFSLRVKLAV